MNKFILVAILFLFVDFVYSQNQEWGRYDFDPLVSIQVPNEGIEFDTIQHAMEIYQLCSETENSTFCVQKILFEDMNQNENYSQLPYDLNSLIEHYKWVSEGMESSVPYRLKSHNLIDKEVFKGYKLKFVDSLNSPIFESQYYLLNKNIYSLFYSSMDYSIKEKNKFFNSLEINTEKGVSQFLGKSRSDRIAYLVGQYTAYILMLAGVIYLLRRKK